MTCDKSKARHRHHIIPRYKGGSDDENNLVEVSVTQHAMYHFCNFQLWGNVEDYVAWRGLSGQIATADFIYEKTKIFGKIGGEIFAKQLEEPGKKEEWRRRCRISFERSVHKEKIINFLKANQKRGCEAARTPENIDKKKKTLKKIKHQQGEKNSQYGKMWFHNLTLRKNVRINKDDLIPDGWNPGRIMNFDRYFEKQEKRIKNAEKVKEKRILLREQKIKFYTEWYGIYKNVEFKVFCEITGYNKSQQNLCSMFKEFVDSYSPKAKNGHSMTLPQPSTTP
jgi:hypothetical protein